jgi:predicted DNA-binding transcriptional regulator AlpA
MSGDIKGMATHDLKGLTIMTKSPYINAQQVACILKVTMRTLHTYVKKNRIPNPIWLGGKRLWVEQSVHDYIGAAINKRRRS